MATTRGKRQDEPPVEPDPPSAPARSGRHPEKKFGPFAGGLSVAIWLNAVETDNGTRQYRSVTIAPRRYFDRTANEWRDSSGYNPGDLPALLYALQKAQEFCFETPLPGGQQSSDNGQSEPGPF